VGSVAAFVNIVIVIWLVEQFNMEPLWANVLGFLIAFCFSYTGQRYWTFARKNVVYKTSTTIKKFFIVSSTNFVLNEGLFFVFLRIFNWEYVISLFITLLIAAVFSYTFSRWWAFK
jgi:putative flippase GtrA